MRQVSSWSLGLLCLLTATSAQAAHTQTAAEAGVQIPADGPTSQYPSSAIMGCVLNIMPYSEWKFATSRFDALPLYTAFCKKQPNPFVQACVNELRDVTDVGE